MDQAAAIKISLMNHPASPAVMATFAQLSIFAAAASARQALIIPSTDHGAHGELVPAAIKQEPVTAHPAEAIAELATAALAL